MSKICCNYCQNEISGFRVHCNDCSDFDLCLQCFSLGAEIGGHKRSHEYKLTSDYVVSAFDVDQPWTLAEETMLLDAVEQYGFGNWEDVANHVEKRTAEDCEDHYITFFVSGSIGKVTIRPDAADAIKDHTCPNGGPLSPSITEPITPIELSLPEQQELGYMPLRDDFEREHDNDAEVLISSLANNYDDEDIDIAMKLAQVERYRTRLKERERRKRIARGYNLIQSATTIGKQKFQTPKKRIHKEEREFQDKMKVFAQFHTLPDHEAFLENIQKEKDLKERIQELMKYRRHGITKLDDIDVFEDEKYKRDKKKENKKKMGNITPLSKRSSMASKKAAVASEEKLDILIDEDELKDENNENIPKEASSMPGYDLLSDRERKLCNSIGMSFANYMTIKTCIIKDYLQRRQGIPIKIRYPSGLDKTHRRRIISFLTDNGWIGVT